jgi:hypothetical protein
MKRILFISLVVCLGASIFLPATAANSAYNQPVNISDLQALGIVHGAHLRPVVNYDTVLQTYNSASGKPIGILMYFMDWSGVPNNNSLVFDTFLADKIKNVTPAPVIMLTWQPINGLVSEGCDQNYGSIPLSNITQGKCDTYIRAFATELSARPERFLLRFAHEMNITDSKWWPGWYGQNASAKGKHNIEWVWSINYASNPVDAWNAIPNYYPGDAYVDWIGLSGFNWYNSPGHTMPWKSFNDLYNSVLKDLTCRYAKPQLITEIGTAGSAAEKAAWIQDAYSKLPQYAFLRGIVWFNDYAYADPKYADFRVVDTPLINSINTQITTSYQNSISTASYVSALPSLTAATPGSTVCQDKNLFIPSVFR